MTLFIYIAKNFLFNVLKVQAALLSLLLLIVTADVMRFFSERGVDAQDYIQLILVTVPASMSLTFPLVVLLGSMFTFLGMSRSSELVIVRASGVSALKMLLAPILITVLLGVIGVAVLNPILAATIRKTSDIRAEFTGQGGSQLSISREGLCCAKLTRTAISSFKPETPVAVETCFTAYGLTNSQLRVISFAG